MAAVKGTGVNDSIAAALSELDVVFTLKEEYKLALKAFLSRKHLFALHLTCFGKTFIKRCSNRVAVHGAVNVTCTNGKPQAR